MAGRGPFRERTAGRAGGVARRAATTATARGDGGPTRWETNDARGRRRTTTRNRPGRVGARCHRPRGGDPVRRIGPWPSPAVLLLRDARAVEGRHLPEQARRRLDDRKGETGSRPFAETHAE